jgi:uncharacterized membrane protein (UPF0127 family)
MNCRRILLALCLAVASVAPAFADMLEKRDLTITTSAGPQHFTVELARTAEQRQRGLMYRQDLAADAGMLFIYASDGEIDMWMANTLLPLDMIFFAADGRITKVAERTVPLSEATIGSDGPARGVLEVNGGTASRLGIRVGDRLTYQQ